MDRHVVIMAGGIGSRFWPMSTPEHPKQFIDVLGCGRTLIQMTADRLLPLCPYENMWVVTSRNYIDIVREQLPGIPEANILAEPEARITAPCIARDRLRLHPCGGGGRPGDILRQGFQGETGSCHGQGLPCRRALPLECRHLRLERLHHHFRTAHIRPGNRLHHGHDGPVLLHP